jgi:hypothetical protein
MKIRRVDGFVMLTTVLIMTVVVVLLLVGQLWLQTNEAWSMRAWRMSVALSSLAQDCLHLSYRSIELNNVYSGQSLSLGDNLCIIEALREANDYQITVTASKDEYYKKFQTKASLVAGQLTVSDWQEMD